MRIFIATPYDNARMFAIPIHFLYKFKIQTVTQFVRAPCGNQEEGDDRKIGKGESEEEIALWDEEIEDNLERADNTTRRIHDAIKAIDLKEV